MDDLIAFLKARLDEDEQVARHASDGPWVKHVGYISGGPTGATRVTQQAQAWNADHIARHDPARALREVEAKRRLISLHEITVEGDGNAVISTLDGKQLASGYDVRCAVCGWATDDPTSGCETIRLLALSYADHPDYRPEWKP